MAGFELDKVKQWGTGSYRDNMSENLTWMGISLMNAYSTDANVSFTVFNKDGTELSTITDVLPGNSQIVDLIDHYFSKTANIYGNAIDFKDVARINVTSDQPVCGINISGNGNSQLLFTKAEGDGLKSDTLYIPHIAEQFGSWSNLLIFDNPSNSNAVVTLNLYSNGSQQVEEEVIIPANSNLVVDLNQYSTLVVDSGNISNVPSTLGVRLSYQFKSTGGTAEFAIDKINSNKIVYNFPNYASDKLTWMGLAVYNPFAEETGLTLTAYKDGVAVEVNSSLTLQGFSKYAAVLENIFPTAYGSGIDKVDITANAENGKITGINISGSNQDRYLFTKADIVFE